MLILGIQDLQNTENAAFGFKELTSSGTDKKNIRSTREQSVL